MKFCNDCVHMVEIQGYVVITDIIRTLYCCYYDEENPRDIGYYAEKNETPIPAPDWCPEEEVDNENV